MWVLFVPSADWLAHHDVGSVTGSVHETAVDNARGRLLTLGAGLFAAGALAHRAELHSVPRRAGDRPLHQGHRAARLRQTRCADRRHLRLGAGGPRLGQGPPLWWRSSARLSVSIPASRMLAAEGQLDITLTATAIDLPGDPPVLVITAAPQQPHADPLAAAQGGGERRRKRGGENSPGHRCIDRVDDPADGHGDHGHPAAARQQHVQRGGDPAAVRQAARREIWDWVIIDMERAGQLRRQFATGAARQREADQLARTARGVATDPSKPAFQTAPKGVSKP